MRCGVEAPFSPLLEGEGPSSLLGAFLDFGVLNVVHMVVSMFSIYSHSVLNVFSKMFPIVLHFMLTHLSRVLGEALNTP
jgi:hypothetical protein